MEVGNLYTLVTRFSSRSTGDDTASEDVISNENDDRNHHSQVNYDFRLVCFKIKHASKGDDST